MLRQIQWFCCLSIILAGAGGCAQVAPRKQQLTPLPPYNAPAPIAQSIPEGAKVGYVAAIFKGTTWLTPPPQVGGVIVMVNPQISRLLNVYVLSGIGDMGQLRVLDVKEYARTVMSDGTTSVIFEVVYKKETIQLNIPVNVNLNPTTSP